MIHGFVVLNIVISSYILTVLLSAFADQWKPEATWCLTEVGNTMSSADTYFGLIL
jgi:hypothetical protein